MSEYTKTKYQWSLYDLVPIENLYWYASRTTSASQASAVGVPRPGLMSKRPRPSESMRQPEPNAARNSSSATRRHQQKVCLAGCGAR